MDICELKERFLDLVEEQIENNINNVDTKELGEVMDMAKDCSYIMRNCAEAKYYITVTDAMETGGKYLEPYRNRMYYNHTEMDIDTMLDEISTKAMETDQAKRVVIKNKLTQLINKL